MSNMAVPSYTRLNYQLKKYSKSFITMKLGCRTFTSLKCLILITGTLLFITYFFTKESFYPFDEHSDINICPHAELSKFTQSSINKPKNAIEKRSLNYISFLKNPCWYETFDDSDVEHMRHNPYQITYSGKGFNNLTFLTIMNGFANYYLKMLKNRQNQRLRCIPYFYIIGQPKCASSDFYKSINSHPQIKPGLVKETQWWAWTAHGIRNKSNPETTKDNADDAKKEIFPLELADLADMFSNVSITWQKQLESHCEPHPLDACQQQIISDGSVYTLSLAYQLQDTGTRRGMMLEEPIPTPEFLKWLVPQAKVILLAREPGDRWYSAYKYFRNKDNRMKKNKIPKVISPDNFHEEITNYLEIFNECLRNSTIQDCRFYPKLPKGQDMLLSDSAYSVYLEEWIRVLGAENVLVIRTEDYYQKRMETLDKTFKFLEVCDPSPEIRRELAMTEKLNEGKIEIGPMKTETRKLLSNFFRPYNIKLAEMLNDRRFLWDDILST